MVAVGLFKVMEVLMSLQGSQMETDDPITSYMLQEGVIPSIMCVFFLIVCLCGVVGVGQTVQVSRAGFSTLYERSYASFTSVCST